MSGPSPSCENEFANSPLSKMDLIIHSWHHLLFSWSYAAQPYGVSQAQALGVRDGMFSPRWPLPQYLLTPVSRCPGLTWQLAYLAAEQEFHTGPCLLLVGSVQRIYFKSAQDCDKTQVFQKAIHKVNQPPKTRKHSVCNSKNTNACGYRYKN